MKISEVVEFLENRFPLKKQEEWDHCGLLVKGEDETATMLVALTLTREVIKKADSLNSKLIICHHPLFFQDEAEYLDKVKIKELISILKEGGMNFYTLHTSYDKILMNRYLLNKLDLNINTIENLEMGAIGLLREALELKELINILKDKLNLEYIRTANVDLNRSIKKIGLCGGSGKGFLDIFIEKADVFITGDLNYHSFEKAVYFDFPIMDIGHYNSEILGFKGAYDLLYDKYGNKAVYFEDKDFQLNY